MLAHTESQGGLRTHEPLRNSTLRQVASTDENPDGGVTPNSCLVHSSLFSSSHVGEYKHFQKIVRLGISNTIPITTRALLSSTTFPESITKGRLITIELSPAPNGATQGQSRSGKERDESSAYGLTDRTYKHLFTTEPLTSDPNPETEDAQILISATDAARCGLKPSSQVLVSTIIKLPMWKSPFEMNISLGVTCGGWLSQNLPERWSKKDND